MEEAPRPELVASGWEGISGRHSGMGDTRPVSTSHLLVSSGLLGGGGGSPAPGSAWGLLPAPQEGWDEQVLIPFYWKPAEGDGSALSVGVNSPGDKFPEWFSVIWPFSS